MIDDKGWQITEQAAISAQEGMSSRPAAHQGLRDARVRLNDSGVVLASTRVEID